MEIREITDIKLREEFNKLAKHPLQAWEWGEFRKKTGVQVSRWGVFENNKLVSTLQATIHNIPFTPFRVGYAPKSDFPDKVQTQVLEKIARKYNCIFVKLEPLVEKKYVKTQEIERLKKLGFKKGRSLFTKYNFVLDVTKSEEELLKNMKSKTRYNVRYAKRKGVKVKIDDSSEAFEKYLELVRTTTKRQGFYAHGEEYHRKMWNILRDDGDLGANLIKAEYEGEVLVAWILFTLHDTLYYPYGASSNKHRNLMASNLIMWEAIKYAKKNNLKYFDMWGALSDNPDKNHSWYGFHRFKEGYGARHVEYVGTYDYVNKPFMYKVFRVLNEARWWVLRLMKN